MVVLQGTDPHRAPSRVNSQLVVGVQPTPGEGAGYHRPGSPGRERPVDPQAGTAVVDGRRSGGQQVVQGGP